MTMVYCRGCAHQIHETALACPQCGAQQTAAKPALANKGSLGQKLHMTMTVSAGLAVLLLYTTHAIWLVGICNGLSLGLAWRLFVTHRANAYLRTKKVDWIALMSVAAFALVLMMFDQYPIQALLLIILSVRALIMYFSVYSAQEPSVPA